MIKFFRKIRQRLLTENKFSKYLIYAIGEIILVVIGILIALQINNANEARKLRQVEYSYLERMVVDLKENKELWTQRYDSEVERAEAAREILRFSFSKNQDTIARVLRNWNIVASWTDLVINQVTFNEMVSSGNLDLIKNDSIKLKLLDLDKQYQIIKGRWKWQKEYVLAVMGRQSMEKLNMRYLSALNPETNQELKIQLTQEDRFKYIQQLIKEFKMLFSDITFMNYITVLSTDMSLITEEYQKAKSQVLELIPLIETYLKMDSK